VVVGGREIPAGETVLVVWASANRDDAVMGDPDELRLDRDPAVNLLYGLGVHACPGAPLARLELRLVLEELLGAAATIELGDDEPVRAAFPAGGFAAVNVRIG
jgi:cytochrome P450